MKTEQEIRQEINELGKLIHQLNHENDLETSMYYCGMKTILKEWVLK